MVGDGSGYVADTGALRTYAQLCSELGDEVRGTGVRIGIGGEIPSRSWDGGGMTLLLTLQDSLDETRAAYDRCRAATEWRLRDVGEALLRADAGLRDTANEYDGAEHRSRSGVHESGRGLP